MHHLHLRLHCIDVCLLLNWCWMTGEVMLFRFRQFDAQICSKQTHFLPKTVYLLQFSTQLSYHYICSNSPKLGYNVFCNFMFVFFCRIETIPFITNNLHYKKLKLFVVNKFFYLV